MKPNCNGQGVNYKQSKDGLSSVNISQDMDGSVRGGQRSCLKCWTLPVSESGGPAACSAKTGQCGGPLYGGLFGLKMELAL